MQPYNPSSWYWTVAGNTTRAWSSASASYVTDSDADYAAWMAGGNTPSSIASEAELVDVLTNVGLAQSAPNIPKTVYPSRVLMQTLFTEAEQQAIFQAAQTPEGWQIFAFIAFTAATPLIDIRDAEFINDIKAVKNAGLLTADRAAQVLAGTPASAPKS